MLWWLQWLINIILLLWILWPIEHGLGDQEFVLLVTGHYSVYFGTQRIKDPQNLIMRISKQVSR